MKAVQVQNTISSSRVRVAAFGEELVFATTFIATVNKQKAQIFSLGSMFGRNVTVACTGTGSLEVYTMYRRFGENLTKLVEGGEDSFTVDAYIESDDEEYGHRTVRFIGCKFDTNPLATQDGQNVTQKDVFQFTFDDVRILRDFDPF